MNTPPLVSLLPCEATALLRVSTVHISLLLRFWCCSEKFPLASNVVIYVGPALHNTALNAMFAPPWTTHNRFISISSPENAPIGYILFSLPAIEPMSQIIVTDVRLSGNYSDHFSLEPKTGKYFNVLKISAQVCKMFELCKLTPVMVLSWYSSLCKNNSD